MSVRGLPGPKNVIDPSGGVVPYQLAADGTIAFSPLVDQVADGRVSGRGTNALTILF